MARTQYLMQRPSTYSTAMGQRTGTEEAVTADRRTVIRRRVLTGDGEHKYEELLLNQRDCAAVTLTAWTTP